MAGSEWGVSSFENGNVRNAEPGAGWINVHLTLNNVILKAMNDQASELEYSRATAELAEAMAKLRTVQQMRRHTR